MLMKTGQALIDQRLDRTTASLTLLHAFSDEPLDHAGKRTPLGLGARRHITHGFGIKRPRLSPCRMQPAIGRKIRTQRYAFPLHGDQAHEIEEEGLARAIFADD